VFRYKSLKGIVKESELIPGEARETDGDSDYRTHR